MPKNSIPITETSILWFQSEVGYSDEDEKNIDPYCGDLEGIFLYNLDDLSKIANENIQARMGEIGLAKTEISRRSSMVAERLFTKASL